MCAVRIDFLTFTNVQADQLNVKDYYVHVLICCGFRIENKDSEDIYL